MVLFLEKWKLNGDQDVALGAFVRLDLFCGLGRCGVIGIIPALDAAARAQLSGYAGQTGLAKQGAALGERAKTGCSFRANF